MLITEGPTQTMEWTGNKTIFEQKQLKETEPRSSLNIATLKYPLLTQKRCYKETEKPLLFLQKEDKC